MTIQLKTSQHWFMQWLGAITRQSITLTNVDQVLWYHMTWSGTNEFTTFHSYKIYPLKKCCSNVYARAKDVTFRGVPPNINYHSKWSIYRVYKQPSAAAFSLNVKINGSVQDCSISSALALEILKSCTKPSICTITYIKSKPWKDRNESENRCS